MRRDAAFEADYNFWYLYPSLPLSLTHTHTRACVRKMGEEMVGQALCYMWFAVFGI